MTPPLAGRALAALAVLSLAGCGPGSSPGPGTGGGPVSSVVVQLTRDGAIGQRYAAPGPRHCSPAGIPGDGAPSNGQAAAYVICGWEGVDGGGTLTLVSHVSIQVGEGRPFSYATDGFDGVNSSKTVYPISGSLQSYRCVTPGSVNVPAPGQTCTTGQSPSGKGVCYRTTTGAWRCTFFDKGHDIDKDTYSPPPGAQE